MVPVPEQVKLGSQDAFLRGGNTGLPESREITLPFIHFVTKRLITPLPHGEITLGGGGTPRVVYFERFTEKKVNIF